MMKVKFNKYERAAGFFVGFAILGFCLSLLSIAVKQGWFDSKVYYTTSFKAADGIHPGTMVQIAGLKVGQVDSVELMNDNSIQVRFYVLSKFQPKVKEDSVAQLIRPFIIGDRVLEVQMGSEHAEALAADATMYSHETMDLMTLISGKQVGNYLETMSGMMENLKTVAEAFLDKNRTKAFINMFDRIDPLLKNLNTMSVEVIKLSKQATQDDNLKVVLGQLAVTTKELNSMIPQFSEKAPHIAKDLTQLVSNMAILTEEFKVVLPALAEVAPNLPQTTRRAVEALDEAVVLIKAMQKSFFVRGSVEEVRELEAKEKARNKERLPAAEKNAEPQD